VCLSAGTRAHTRARRQNKLQTPLKEIFSTCLNAQQLRQLLHGPHTQFRASGTTAGEALQSPAAGLSPGFGAPPPVLAAAGGSKGGGSRRTPSKAAAQRAPLGSPGDGGHGGSGGKKKGAAGGRQQGMKMFAVATARCLGCKTVLPHNTAGGGGGGRQQQQQQPPGGVEPGLCSACRQDEGKWAAVYLHAVQEQGRAAAAFCAAHSACRRCHSGGQMGGVVCSNGECPVVFARFEAERQLRNADHRLRRLDW
jgi:hypothetical protein